MLVGFAARAARGRAGGRLRRRADLLRGAGHARPDRPGRPVLGRAHHAGHPARPDPGLRPGVPAVLPRTRPDALPEPLRLTRRSAAPRRAPCSRSRRPSPARGPRRAARPSSAWSPPTRTSLRSKAFAACTPEELAALRRIMAQDAAHPAAPPHPAHGRRATGRAPDLRRTVRETMRHARRARRAVLAAAAAAAAAADPDPRRLRVDGRLLAQPAAVRPLGHAGRRPGRGVLLRHPADPDHPRAGAPPAPTTRSTGPRPRSSTGRAAPGSATASTRSSATGPGAGCAAAGSW